MIISDLQHIESATETDVQGGGDRWRPFYTSFGCNSCSFEGIPGLEDFGTYTGTFTSTNTLVIEGQSSDSDYY